MLARYIANPGASHFNELRKVQGYLLKFPDIGLIYNCKTNNLQLKGYTDSDQAQDINNSRSISGYIFSLGDITNINPISWSSQVQKTIALSSAEAEYIALREATKEGIYLRNILSYLNSRLNLGYTDKIPPIFIDNEAAKKIAENPEFYKRTKHIRLQYHFTREAVRNKDIRLLSIKSKSQAADILTKLPVAPLYRDYKRLLGLDYN